MNEIEPARRFSLEAVRKHERDNSKSKSGQLNAAARQIASQYRRDTMSPIMVSGVLRLIELALLVVSGAVLFAYYVGLETDLAWHYPAVIASASLIAVILLDITDCYQLSALVRPVANLGRITIVWAGTLALFAVAGFFLKLADDFSRLWFGGWFVAGLVLLLGLASPARAHDHALGAQRHHGAPRRHRRRRQGRRGADPFGRAAARQRHPHLRHLRRPRRQALAAGGSRLSQARHHLRAHRIRPHRTHRHADRLAAADGRNARAGAAEEALGAAGRHPALGAFEPAAVPPALLFLHRLGADARHLRQADQRLGFGRQAGLRHRLQPDRRSSSSRR